MNPLLSVSRFTVLRKIAKYAGIPAIVLGTLMYSCQTAGTTGQEPKLPQALADNGGISLPSGFGAVLVTDSLDKGARHLAIRENGDIYVKLRQTAGGKGIVALRDTDGDGVADQKEMFGNFTGTGMRLHNGYLYASSDTMVMRYKLQENALLPDTTAEVIVSGFPVQRSHASKPMAFDGAGNMYVTVGAPSNACQEEARKAGSPGIDPCPQRDMQAGIWKFSDSKLNQTHTADGVNYARGIRNAVAICWNKSANSLYALQHGRDQLNTLWPEKFTDEDNEILPAEEFLQISDGDDFGWPYCYFNQNLNKKVLGPEYGGDGTETGRCEGIKPPIVAFPGHMAPNDLLFYTGDQFPEPYKNGAFIAFHGSWNRAPLPQAGYFVVFVPMKDGQPSGDWEVFAEGFPQIPEVKNPNDAVYRPVGLSQGPDGSLYISDSRKGRIWRIMYYGV
ncbi:MAG: PQQ-dependent sugar dehydrogenase [Bacteroidia bacterium]